jgi:hypothetical protein
MFHRLRKVHVFEIDRISCGLDIDLLEVLIEV